MMNLSIIVRMSEMSEDVTPAVVRVFLQSRERFLRFLQQRTGRRDVAEEILQAAFLTGIEKGDTLVDEERAQAWCYRLLRNALADHYRRQGATARALTQYGDEAATADTHLADAELQGVVCECLNDLIPQLKPEYAQALQQIDLGGGKLDAFARQQHITVNNATVRLHRSRQALRKELQRCCGACAEHGCLDCTCRHTSTTSGTT